MQATAYMEHSHWVWPVRCNVTGNSKQTAQHDRSVKDSAERCLDWHDMLLSLKVTSVREAKSGFAKCNFCLILLFVERRKFLKKQIT